MTAKGVLVYSDSSASTIFRIDPGTDAKVMVLSGLEYANGLEVDLDGFLYAAEQSGSRVRRIDPANGEFTILAAGLNNPNGLSFSPDYKTLYVGSFGDGTITSIHMKEDMSVESVGPFAAGVGGGALDGMAVDACGNVYVCEFGPATIWRISPNGASMVPLIELGADTGWIPNMQWGSGIGGWDKDTLYVLDFGATRVFAVPLGVGDKPRAYP
jgi:gluconolactonase